MRFLRSLAAAILPLAIGVSACQATPKVELDPIDRWLDQTIDSAWLSEGGKALALTFSNGLCAVESQASIRYSATMTVVTLRVRERAPDGLCPDELVKFSVSIRTETPITKKMVDSSGKAIPRAAEPPSNRWKTLPVTLVKP